MGFSKLEIQATNSDYKDIADNFIIGVRSGLKFSSLLLGADYHAGGPYKFGTLLNRGSWTTKSLGVVVGLDYKVIRFWYGYYPNSQIDDSANNTKYEGSAQKFGFGLVLNPKLRVNIEVMMYDVTGTAIDNTTGDRIAYKPKETNAYISVPVDF